MEMINREREKKTNVLVLYIKRQRVREKLIRWPNIVLLVLSFRLPIGLLKKGEEEEERRPPKVSVVLLTYCTHIFLRSDFFLLVCFLFFFHRQSFFFFFMIFESKIIRWQQQRD